MGWDGYLVLDGTEIMNTTRTEAYALHGGAEWFTPVYENDVLPMLLDHPAYTTPDVDIAPWYDQDNIDSVDFWGLYPISVTGLDDSSRTSTPVDFTSDGGSPGRLRHASKSFVYQVALLGASERAVKYGLRWLTRAGLGRACSNVRADETTLGVTMEVMSVAPEGTIILPGGTPLDGDTIYLYGGDAGGIPPDVPASPEQLFKEFVRYFYDVKMVSGPSLDRKVELSPNCAGAMWIVQFTLLAGNPHEYEAPTPILQGYLDPLVTDPWPPDVPEAGEADTAWATFTDVDCGVQIWQPIYDPLCTAVITPPAPPTIPLGCYDPPASWQRRKVKIPAANVPLWGDTVPVLTVAAATEMRNLRVRWYENPDGDFDPDDNPCDFVGDWVISYVPAGATMVIDGVSQTVRVRTTLGTIRRADSLVFQNDSTPIVWPKITCGYGYIMTLDLPSGEPAPVVDLAFVGRAAA